MPHDPAICRVIDAAANRAREGLRVAEDHARFGLGSGTLASEMRQARLEVTRAVAGLGLDPDSLLLARDPVRDPGRPGARPGADPPREGLAGAAAAGLSRAAEALRSLEEAARVLVRPEGAAAFEGLRYRTYELQRQMALAPSRATLAPLYLILDPATCAGDPLQVLQAALEGGAGWVQIRCKEAGDRAFLSLAREARLRTRRSGAILVVNDRPDIALLSGADGVHLGLEDLPPEEARRILPEGALLGLSTHSPDDVRAALARPHDYLGFGPIAATGTKAAAGEPRGVAAYAELADAVKARTYPIGGITLPLARELAAAGAPGVAVARAVTGASDPREAAAAFCAAMGAPASTG